MNSTTVFLFKRTATPTPPTIPATDLNYAFASGFISGVLEGWEQSLPVTGGAYRWVTSAVVAGLNDSITVPISAWRAVALLSEDGTSRHTATIYKQSALDPGSPPASLSSYDFVSGVLTPPTGWVVIQPNTTTINTWSAEYTFVGLDNETVIGEGYWGQTKIAAVAGIDGQNIHIVTVYKQTIEDIEYPEDGSYKFEGDILVAPIGWSRTMPTVSDVPTYMSTHRFSSNDPLEVIPGSAWSYPVVISRIGYDYISRFNSVCFKYSIDQPATPADGDYDNPVPTGWSDGIPVYVEGQSLWSTSRIFYADNLLSNPWATPVKVSGNTSLSSKLQFSSDNAFWHDEPIANDVYMRSGTNDGNGWVFSASILIKGEQGETGETGSAGVQLYTWIAYAHDLGGVTGFTTGSPTSEHKCIGIAHNQTSPFEGTDPSVYTWTEWVGGVGAPGTNGVTTFSWFAYANSPDGVTDFTTGAWVDQAYMGFATNKFTSEESQDPGDYSWSRIMAEGSAVDAPASPVFTLSNIVMSCPINADGIPVPVASCSWDSVANADSYQLRYKTTDNYTYVTVANTPTTSGVVLTGLLPVTTYSWAVRAFTGTTSSVWSNNDVDFTKATVADTVAPDVPTGLTLTQGLLTVIATWSPLTGLTNQDLRTYRLMVASNAGFSPNQTYDVGASLASFNVAIGTTYWVKVCSVDATGNASAYSSVVSITANKTNGNSIITADSITTTSLAAVSSTLGAVSAGSLTMNTSASYIRGNKSSYADTTAGFWIGNDGTGYRANLGNATSYFKYDSLSGAIEIAGKVLMNAESTISWSNITTGTPPAAVLNSNITADTLGVVKTDASNAPASILNSSLTSSISSAATTANWTSVASRPTTLSGLDSTAGTKLSGIAPNATAGQILNFNPECNDPTIWPSAYIATIADGLTGNTVIAGSVGEHLSENRTFLYNTTRRYRVSALIRKTAGVTAGTIYLGILNYDKEGGAQYGWGGYTYWQMSAASLSTAFTRYSTEIVANSQNAGTVRAAAHIILGHPNTGGGRVEFQDIKVEDVTDSYNASLTADWTNVSNKPTVYTEAEIQDYATTITNNTVTTAFVNALNVTAQSVNAGWVYAGNVEANKITTVNAKITSAQIGSITADVVNASGFTAQTANIGTAQVDTLQIKGNAVTIPIGVTSSASTETTKYVDLTLNTEGGTALFTFSAFVGHERTGSAQLGYSYLSASVTVTRLSDSYVVFSETIPAPYMTSSSLSPTRLWQNFCSCAKAPSNSVSQTYRFAITAGSISNMNFVAVGALDDHA